MAWKASTLVALFACSIAACASTPPPKPSGQTDATIAEGTVPPAPATEEDRGDLGPVPITADDPSWGSPTAPITIVEFGDFQCPFTRRAAATIHALRDKYGPEQLRVVWKNNPLPFHPLARSAAEGAFAAYKRSGDQAFWVYYDAVFGNTRPFSEELYREAMRLAGVPEAGVLALRPKASAKIDADAELATKIGVKGTPNFFINGILLTGAQPVESFVAVIDQELPKAKALVAEGAFPAKVYATRAKANFKHEDAAPARPASPPEDDVTVYNVPVGNSPVRGKATALVTLVEFADYQCPFCGKVETTLTQIEKQYGDKVRIVFKDNPLPFHPHAEPATEVALEVRARKGDAAFWKFHDALFANQKDLEDDTLANTAAQVGLDKNLALLVIKSRRHQSTIEATVGLAEDVEANGTPTFFINGRRLVGAQPFERFATLIDAEITHASGLVKQGTPASGVYEAIIKDGRTRPAPERVTLPPPTARNPSRGPANAKIVVHYFGDYQCPFCKRVEPTLVELEKAYPHEVRIVWHNNPLPMHQRAPLAAEAAMEAFAQKGAVGFWAFHDQLMADQSAIDRPGLDRAAANVGLDMRRFKNALDQHTHADEVERDVKLAADAKLTGTPAFVINGFALHGAQSLSKFKRVAGYALANANKKP